MDPSLCDSRVSSCVFQVLENLLHSLFFLFFSFSNLGYESEVRERARVGKFRKGRGESGKGSVGVELKIDGNQKWKGKSQESDITERGRIRINPTVLNNGQCPLNI